MQFGEGNFLRAFVDYIFDVTNEKTDFNGGVVIVKPIEFGTLERFHDQECQYTLQLRGFENGQQESERRQEPRRSIRLDPVHHLRAGVLRAAVCVCSAHGQCRRPLHGADARAERQGRHLQPVLSSEAGGRRRPAQADAHARTHRQAHYRNGGTDRGHRL